MVVFNKNSKTKARIGQGKRLRARAVAQGACVQVRAHRRGGWEESAHGGTTAHTREAHEG